MGECAMALCCDTTTDRVGAGLTPALALGSDVMVERLNNTGRVLISK